MGENKRHNETISQMENKLMASMDISLIIAVIEQCTTIYEQQDKLNNCFMHNDIVKSKRDKILWEIFNKYAT
jgi:hypothetical protein